MLTVVFPRSILLSFKKIAVVLLKTGWALTSAKTFGVGYAPELIRAILKLFGVTQVFPQTDVETIALMCAFTFAWTVITYIETIITAAYVMIAERKRIKKIRWYKKVWYCITFPIFDLIGKLAMLMALFMKVEWKPIPHKVAIGTDEVK
jgi:hypothetical protein